MDFCLATTPAVQENKYKRLPGLYMKFLALLDIIDFEFRFLLYSRTFIFQRIKHTIESYLYFSIAFCNDEFLFLYVVVNKMFIIIEAMHFESRFKP